MILSITNDVVLVPFGETKSELWVSVVFSCCFVCYQSRDAILYSLYYFRLHRKDVLLLHPLYIYLQKSLESVSYFGHLGKRRVYSGTRAS